MRDFPDIKGRVARLVAGTATYRDLHRIVGWLRFRSRGNWLIKDIGDYAYHLEARTRGSSYDGIQRYVEMLNFLMPRIRSGPGQPHELQSREDLEQGTQATLYIMKDEQIRDNFGLGRQAASKTLDRALRKIGYYDGYRVRIDEGLTAKESQIVNYCKDHLVTNELFDDAALMDQFLDALAKNDLIRPEQEPGLREAQDFLALYAVEAMHNTTLNVAGLKPVRLIASRLNPSRDCEAGDRLAIMGRFSMPWEDNFVGLLLTIFTTKCLVNEHCDADLARYDREWDFPIELNDQRKLFAPDGLVPFDRQRHRSYL